MNVVPNMEFPTLEEVLAYVDKFPCAKEARNVLLSETALGNVIQAVGDAGCMPDETIVVIDFTQDAKCDYPESVYKKWGDNKGYRFVNFSDKYNGNLYLRFFIR